MSGKWVITGALVVAVVIVGIVGLSITQKSGVITQPGVLSSILPGADKDVRVNEEKNKAFENSRSPQAPANAPAIEIVADNLSIPWEVAFLPEGGLLITERPGRLLKIDHDRTVIPIDGVRHVGEGGLLGLALHPDFAENGWLYLYLTTNASGRLSNRVEQYRLVREQLVDRKVIIENIPGAQFHDGGRIAFGPDGLLYITVGDASNGDNAQSQDSLAGKILRLNEDGTIPSDNPFQSPVYSLGHRNPQGLAWDSTGQLWATEHGRSGLRSGFDEVNRIVPGGNFGWPQIEGDEGAAGMIAPAAHSGASTTWAPAGAAFLEGSIFFTGLRGEALYEARLEGGAVTGVVSHLTGEFGRLRTVVVGPDGFLYVTTSNTDGRGQARAGDDKIIKIDPKLFR